MKVAECYVYPTYILRKWYVIDKEGERKEIKNCTKKIWKFDFFAVSLQTISTKIAEQTNKPK